MFNPDIIKNGVAIEVVNNTQLTEVFRWAASMGHANLKGTERTGKCHGHDFPIIVDVRNNAYCYATKKDFEETFDRKVLTFDQAKECKYETYARHRKEQKTTPASGLQESRKIINTEKKMTTKTLKNTVTEVFELNKEAALSTAKRVAGRALIKKVTKLIKPKLPVLVRGYAETPLFEALIGNLIAIALKQYTTNQKAQFAADAMIEASMDSIAMNFNLDSMLDNLLSGISIPGIEEEVVAKVQKPTKTK
jgi:ribosomal protein L18